MRTLYFKINHFRYEVLSPRMIKNYKNEENNPMHIKMKEKIEKLNLNDFYISTGENVFDLYSKILEDSYMFLKNLEIHDCKNCDINIIERDFSKEFNI